MTSKKSKPVTKKSKKPTKKQVSPAKAKKIAAKVWSQQDVLDEVLTALAAECDCTEVGCVHDKLRKVACRLLDAYAIKVLTQACRLVETISYDAMADTMAETVELVDRKRVLSAVASIAIQHALNDASCSSCQCPVCHGNGSCPTCGGAGRKQFSVHQHVCE